MCLYTGEGNWHYLFIKKYSDGIFLSITEFEIVPLHLRQLQIFSDAKHEWTRYRQEKMGPWMESVLVPVNLLTGSHNTRCSSGSSTEKNWQQWSDKQLESTFIPGNEQCGQVTAGPQTTNRAPGCPISPALPLLLTLGLTLEKSLMGNSGCQPHCVSVKGVIFF